MPAMKRQATPRGARDLAVVLHDLAWLLPRTVDPEAEVALDALPASELEVMRLLVRQPGLRVGQVARELGLRDSNASSAIRSLIARGLLERCADPADGRATRLVPTDRASDTRSRREAAWGRTLAARLRRLPDDEAAQLLDAVPALRALAHELGGGA